MGCCLDWFVWDVCDSECLVNFVLVGRLDLGLRMLGVLMCGLLWRMWEIGECWWFMEWWLMERVLCLLGVGWMGLRWVCCFDCWCLKVCVLGRLGMIL